MGPSPDEPDVGGAKWSRESGAKRARPTSSGAKRARPTSSGAKRARATSSGAKRARAAVWILPFALLAGSCKLERTASGPQPMQIDPLPDASRADAGPTPSNGDATIAVADAISCDAGECWWSHTQNGCHSVGLPTLRDRPGDATGDAPMRSEPDVDVGEIYLGFSRIRLDASMGNMMSGSAPGQSIGLDLDGVCTSSSTCPAATAVSCRARTDQVPGDGDACRDNAFARILAIASGLPLIGMQFGFSEEIFNCGLWRGTYNVLARIQGYNGMSNDSQVRVDWYTSSGLERPPSWICPSSDFDQHYPLWRASAPWGVVESELSGAIDPAGKLPDSMLSDSDAYVKDGYLVSRIPDGATLRLAGDAKPFRGFSITAHGGLYLGRISKAQDATWRIQDGLIAGHSTTGEVVRGLRQVGFCYGMGLDPFYKSLVSYAEENADLLASGAVAPDEPCDAMSFGIGFEAAQITPGGIGHAEPLIECCPPGTSAEDCRDICGNGNVTGAELCDTAIPEGDEGSCPKRCDPPQRSCERVSLEGSGCAARCVTTPITTLESGDGCCPPGADAIQDRDCTPVCGNSVLEPGETCDPAESCAGCRSSNPCLAAITSGSNCQASCEYVPVSQCQNADGCCPSGCSRDRDDDCSSSCGNRQLDRGETCEANTDKPCPSGCDDGVACTRDIATGSSANCNLVCTHIPITAIEAGDGCCLEGADSDEDSDCAPVCGNGKVESGEECDDGNIDDGDGCSPSCLLQGALQQCLVHLERKDKCSLCACNKCQAEAEACYGGPTAEEIELCSDLANCVLEEVCNGAECYCGSADLFRCTYGTPNGPCRREVEAAARATGVSAISFRSGDVSYPVGRANVLGNCVYNQCGDACELR